MNKEGGNFFEKHIEKLVLVIAGLVCVWILFTYIAFSPNRVEFDSRKFSPGEIDNYIFEKAKNLERSLNENPKPKSPYDPCFPAFEKLVDSSIKNVNFSLYWPMPSRAPKESRIEKKYRLPRIEELEITDIECGNIRAVAYIPTVNITEDTPYSEVTSQPNDIDIVTIEGHFDVSQLYEVFYESFASNDVRPGWRDPCLANPVFAAVDLQRREIYDDGRESQWQRVSRSRIDMRKDIFKIIEDVKELPAGGIELRILQFSDMDLVKDLLQPESYQIASAEEEWFPPSLHKKYKEHIKSVQAGERRRLLEEKKQEREVQSERRPTMERDNRGGRAATGRGGGRAAAGRGGMTRDDAAISRRSALRERAATKPSERNSIGDIREEFGDILISGDTDLSDMDESLVFWSHDDSVEPGGRYRYKIRLGVFNPIVGTNQFVKEGEDKKEMVILWTDFAETEVIEIPARLIFFANDIQETTNTVTIQVSKYVLGHWYSRSFTVRPGEVIGNVVEYEPEDEFEESLSTTPDMIDYSTGAILVDVEPLTDWYWAGRSLRERYYFDMLYNVDGDEIKHMPIKLRYWSDGLQAMFAEIKREEKEEKQPLRTWQGGGTGRGDGGRGGAIPTRRRRGDVPVDDRGRPTR